MKNTDRRLLLIGPDGRCLSLARALRLVCRVETAPIMASLGSPSPFPHLVAMLGVRLADAMEFAAARSALRPFLLKPVPVLWLLDRVCGQDEKLARMLGATRILSAGDSVPVIAAAIAEMFALHPAARLGNREEAAGEERVQAVGCVLAELMRAAAEGGRPQPGATAEASSLLLNALNTDGIGTWLSTVAALHDQTYRHCLLMAGIMGSFALQLGFSARDCDRLTRAAILHDIGKAQIPLEIIDKNGRLTAAETVIMQGHAQAGYDLLRTQGGYEPSLLEVVRSHHEYLDGSGYPEGLTGNRISDPVRIATVCDVFTALIEKRPYKPGLPATEACRLMEQMGGKLDQPLLRAFKRIFEPVAFFAPARAPA